jgi:hypothetical protein
VVQHGAHAATARRLVAEAWSAGRGRIEAAELARLAQELADERERDSDKDRVSE